MRKILFGVAVAGAVAVTAYFAIRPNAVAETVMLYKNPECGCCEDYAAYIRQNGFAVSVKATDDLIQMSRKAGIPDDYQGCHLAFVGDYVVSGHVPIATVEKLLSERPAIKGVTLPGMPTGSPGMSGPKTESFKIYAVGGASPKLYAIE